MFYFLNKLNPNNYLSILLHTDINEEWSTTNQEMPHVQSEVAGNLRVTETDHSWWATTS